MIKFEPTFDELPDPLCSLASNGYFNSVNKSFEEATGYSREELINSSFFEHLHPDEKIDIVSQIATIPLNATHPFECRFRVAPNEFKRISWRARKATDSTLYISGRVIAHTKEEPEAQAPSGITENYKILFYSNPLPIVIYDMESLAVVHVNLMASELYGYSREEFVQLSITDIRPVEDIPLVVEAIKQRSFNPEIKNLGIWKHLKKNGELMNVEVIGHSITYLNRHCMIVACNDVTEQTHTLQSLQQSIERFEYVTEATSDIIWDWDLVTNQIYYSNNMKKLFGHSSNNDIGGLHFFAQQVHPDDRERVVLYPDSFKYGRKKYWLEEYRFREADGEYAYVLDKGIVIRDEDGTGIRMIGAMQDITELKNKELHIAKQNAQLIEIALLNAHITRRPVATILGLMDLIDRQTIADHGTLEVLTHLQTTTRELDGVVRSIIDTAGG